MAPHRTKGTRGVGDTEPIDTRPSLNSNDSVCSRANTAAYRAEREHVDLLPQRLRVKASDPPKKVPKNPFLVYARTRCPIVQEENPSMCSAEVSKVLSDNWKSMTAVEKQVFVDSAKEVNSRNRIYHRRPNNRKRCAVSRDMHSPDELTEGLAATYAENTDNGEIPPLDSNHRDGLHFMQASQQTEYGGVPYHMNTNSPLSESTLLVHHMSNAYDLSNLKNTLPEINFITQQLG